MCEWAAQALDRTGAGVIVADASHHIVFWNCGIARISGIPREDALGKKLGDVCSRLAEKRYQDILDNLFSTGQSRFCSGVLHKCFVVPRDCQEPGALRQNLRVEPIRLQGEVRYAFLQIDDITEQAQSELKLRQHIEQLKKGYQEIKESVKAVRKKVSYDQLTGALNRWGLESQLHQAILDSRARDAKLAVLFLDLDCFKDVNDRYGHMVGDVLLMQTAGRLKSGIRRDYRRHPDILARIGGDEFVIVLPDVRDRQEVVCLAGRFVETIRKPLYIDNNSIRISASIGIALYPDDAGHARTLIEKADQAMYRVKQSGKDRFGFWDGQALPGGMCHHTLPV